MAIAPRSAYFDHLETMSALARKTHFEDRLVRTITNAYKRVPAARERLDRAGVKPGDIRTVKDLEKIPIIRKTDLLEMQKANPPYGGLLGVKPEYVERVFISPGPIYEPLHVSSIQWFAKAFFAAGFKRGDMVVNTFTYHMSPAGILFHEALRDCGATVVVMGTGNTDVQIKTMLDLKATGFVGTPSFLMTVIKRAEEMGYDIRRDFKLRLAWFTGERLAPSVRKVLEGDYLISTSQAYAVTEPGGAIAYECKQKSGMHLMDEYITEIVDPATGRQLPPGQLGEIVVTPIYNRVWGLIRFGTGDMSSYTTEPCPCGRTSARLTGIVGRTGDAVKVRGMFVVARQADEVAAGFPAVSAFQLVVDRRDNRDHLTLKLETKSARVSKEKLTRELNQKFQDVCRVKIDNVEFLDKGTIPEKSPKLVDQRKWD